MLGVAFAYSDNPKMNYASHAKTHISAESGPSVQFNTTGQTLIVSWHWPPTKRASTQVLATLFGEASAQDYAVLTRDMRAMSASEEMSGGDATETPDLPTQSVTWPGKSDEDGTIRTWIASIITAFRFWRVGRKSSADRILAVYPHRYSLLAGWLIACTSHKPLVVYMHDLFAETLIAKNKLKRAFWKWVDRRVMRNAALVVVPTREFAGHYQKRGVNQTWVLPHCIAKCEPTPLPSFANGLRMTYAGSIYQAHEDSIERLIEGTRDVEGIALTFLAQPHPMLAGQDVQWLDRVSAMATLANSHVLVVALGHETPYPEEVQGCFPSKIVDYLAVGRPILAIVPPGCFVNRYITETGCGISVTSRNPADIRIAIESFKDPQRLKQFAHAARTEARKLDSKYWVGDLTNQLATVERDPTTNSQSSRESHQRSDRARFSQPRPTCEV